MDERLKILRKELNFTQQEFSDRLGVSRSTYAQYETGRAEPSAAVFMLICREFNVNEEWLRSGQGEMFVHKEGDAARERLKKMIDELLADSEETFRQGLLEIIVRMDIKQIQAVKEYARRYLLPSLQDPKAAGGSGTQKEILTAKEELEIAREVEDYREQLRAEKIAAARSEASSTTEERREA